MKPVACVCMSVIAADHPYASKFDLSGGRLKTFLVHWDHTSFVAGYRAASDACTAFTNQFSVGGRVKDPFRPSWDSATFPKCERS